MLREQRHRKKADYEWTALFCVPGDPRLGLRCDYFDFFERLGWIFTDEQKSFFRWLMAEVDFIQFGRKVLPKHGVSEKSTNNAMNSHY